MSVAINCATSKDWRNDLIFVPTVAEIRPDEISEAVTSPFVWHYISIPSDQTWFWSRDWQERESEAEADLENGHYRTFDDVEDFLIFLDSDKDE